VELTANQASYVRDAVVSSAQTLFLVVRESDSACVRLSDQLSGVLVYAGWKQVVAPHATRDSRTNLARGLMIFYDPKDPNGESPDVTLNQAKVPQTGVDTLEIHGRSYVATTISDRWF
jgi:hypothetical protein